ncbi:MAG: hypothetical protein E6J20_17680 [Chloroflexi bacterium]|nr:MAG: hypothetical protein E6J20_17680 [Chloroflexota bacterium]
MNEQRHVRTTASFYDDFLQEAAEANDGLYAARIHNLGRRLFLVEAWFHIAGHGTAADLTLPTWIEPGQSIEVTRTLSRALRDATAALDYFEHRPPTSREIRDFHVEFIDGEGHTHRTHLDRASRRRLTGLIAARPKPSA